MNQDFRKYQETAQTKLFNKYGVFFLCGDSPTILKGLDEKKIEFIKSGLMNETDKFCILTNMGGYICPSKNSKLVRAELETINKNKVAKDIKANGIDKIIVRELYNYETFVSYDLSDVLNALHSYNITEKQVTELFKKEIPIFEAHN